MTFHDALELASFGVTVFGLPFAIGVFLFEQRRERENEEEEAYVRCVAMEVRPGSIIAT